jgi:hypothetical protein
VDARRANQSEEGGQKAAARGPGADLHHTGKFRGLDEQKGRAKHARLSEPATVWSMMRSKGFV